MSAAPVSVSLKNRNDFTRHSRNERESTCTVNFRERHSRANSQSLVRNSSIKNQDSSGQGLSCTSNIELGSDQFQEFIFDNSFKSLRISEWFVGKPLEDFDNPEGKVSFFTY